MTGSSKHTFSLMAEHKTLMMKCIGTQLSRPRAGVTRAQLSRFYKRWDTIRAALDANIKVPVDNALDTGHTQLEERGRYTYLWDAEHNDAPGFGSKAARDYIHLCLDMPDMARTY